MTRRKESRLGTGDISRLSPDLERDGFWVETPIEGDDRWLAVGLFLERQGQMVLSELRIIPRDFLVSRPHNLGEWSRDPDAVPQGGMTSAHTRAVKVGDLIEGGQETARDVIEQFQLHGGSMPLIKAALRREPERPGRAGREDIFYAMWAWRYAQALPSRTINKDLATKYASDLPETNPVERVRDLIHQARERDLLPKGQQGRASGTLTPKARGLLKEAGIIEEAKPSKKKKGK